MWGQLSTTSTQKPTMPAFWSWAFSIQREPSEIHSVVYKPSSRGFFITADWTEIGGYLFIDFHRVSLQCPGCLWIYSIAWVAMGSGTLLPQQPNIWDRRSALTALQVRTSYWFSEHHQDECFSMEVLSLTAACFCGCREYWHSPLWVNVLFCHGSIHASLFNVML